jgi:hypothetical protein
MTAPRRGSPREPSLERQLVCRGKDAANGVLTGIAS